MVSAETPPGKTAQGRQTVDEFFKQIEEELEEARTGFAEKYGFRADECELKDRGERVTGNEDIESSRRYELQAEDTVIEFIVNKKASEISDSYRADIKMHGPENRVLWNLYMDEVYEQGDYEVGQNYTRVDDDLDLTPIRSFERSLEN